MTDSDVIRFDCASCGKTLKVSADKAGKKGRCPHCRVPIEVPEIELDYYEDTESWMDQVPHIESNDTKPTAQPSAEQWAGKPGWVRAMLTDEWAGAMLFGVAFIWLLVLLRVFGLDLLHLLDRKSTASPVSLTMYFFIALGLSAIAIPIGLLRLRRALSILSRGVEVPGWIAKEGMGFITTTGASGKKVTIGYEFEGKTYHTAITDTLFKKLEEKLGVKPTAFVVIVDPNNPKRALVDERAIDSR